MAGVLVREAQVQTSLISFILLLNLINAIELHGMVFELVVPRQLHTGVLTLAKREPGLAHLLEDGLGRGTSVSGLL